jgi:hypothetical protein
VCVCVCVCVCLCVCVRRQKRAKASESEREREREREERVLGRDERREGGREGGRVKVSGRVNTVISLSFALPTTSHRQCDSVTALWVDDAGAGGMGAGTEVWSAGPSTAKIWDLRTGRLLRSLDGAAPLAAVDDPSGNNAAGGISVACCDQDCRQASAASRSKRCRVPADCLHAHTLHWYAACMLQCALYQVYLISNVQQCVVLKNAADLPRQC